MHNIGESCPHVSGAEGGRWILGIGWQSDHAEGTEADARDSGRRPAPSAALLSMGHNSSLPPRKTHPEENRQEWRENRNTVSKVREKQLLPSIEKPLVCWPEGARADFPGIPNLDPNRIDKQLRPGGPDQAKRGQVTEFSHKSRRRLQRVLATMKLSAVAYTMALTLPGCDVALFDHAEVMEAFEKVSRRLSASKRFPGVSGFWKRELQSRGAIHYHLILYGLGNDKLRAEFQAWMVRQWTSFFTTGPTPEQHEQHRWWHSREENMQLVRDFSGYFSKYLGKDGEAGSLPGRWWGSFNKRLLPKAARAEAKLIGKATVMIHRLARSYRSEKINAGKHRADASQLKKAVRLGVLNLSQVDLWRLRSGYDLKGYRNARLAAIQLGCYLEICKAFGVRPGKFPFRGKVPKTAPIVLCGASAPVFAAKALDFVNQSLGLSLNLEEESVRAEFVPDPLRAVPLGRIPRNAVRLAQQADFLGDLHLVPQREVRNYQIHDDLPRVRG